VTNHDNAATTALVPTKSAARDVQYCSDERKFGAVIRGEFSPAERSLDSFVASAPRNRQPSTSLRAERSNPLTRMQTDCWSQGRTNAGRGQKKSSIPVLGRMMQQSRGE
jgi:hypothetical protein